MGSKLLSANATPRDTVKQFFVELDDMVEKVVERIAVDLIKGAVKYLYEKIKHWLRKPKHHAVDAVNVSIHVSVPPPSATVLLSTGTKHR